jgi:hypothetical protein
MLTDYLTHYENITEQDIGTPTKQFALPYIKNRKIMCLPTLWS